MAFEAKLVKPLSWCHMMVLRRKPSGGHRTIGLTVVPLRVLSRLRRPLAQKWENDHDAAYFWGCQGKACDRAAWTPSWWRQQSAASLLLDLAKFYEHVGHDHLFFKKVGKPVFQRDFWLLGALHTKAGAFSRPTNAPLFLSGPLGPVFQVAMGPRQRSNSGNPFRNSGNAPPNLQAVERGRRHFGPRGGNSQDGRPPGTRSASLQGQIKSLHRWAGQAQACPFAAVGGARDRRVRHSPQRWSRSAAGQAAAGARRQGAAGESYEENEARQAASEGRGTHTRNLTLTGSNAGVFWGSEVLGFTPTQLQSIRVDAAKATYRLSRGQNAATTMMAHALAAGAKNIDPAFRHHRQVILAWATGVWEGTPDLDTVQAALCGSSARLSHLKWSWCCATDAAATFVLTLLRLERPVGQASHHPRWHQDRPPGSGVQDCELLGGPGIPFVVRQLCTVEPVQGPVLLGSHQTTPRFWQAGGLVTLASQRAFLARHLDPGKACAAQGGEDDGSCQLCNDGPGTMFHRCYECPALQAERDMYVSQEVPPGCTFCGFAIQGAVCTWHFS